MRRAASIAATGALACALLSPLAAAAAAPPAWIIDKAASSLRFTSSMGGEGFTGAFRRWDADIGRGRPKRSARARSTSVEADVP